MKQLSLSAVAAMAAAALVTATISGQDASTVTRDRLVNAQGEPNSWLMMNGDYGSTRYSKSRQEYRGCDSRSLRAGLATFAADDSPLADAVRQEFTAHPTYAGSDAETGDATRSAHRELHCGAPWLEMAGRTAGREG